MKIERLAQLNICDYKKMSWQEIWLDRKTSEYLKGKFGLTNNLLKKIKYYNKDRLLWMYLI